MRTIGEIETELREEVDEEEIQENNSSYNVAFTDVVRLILSKERDKRRKFEKRQESRTDQPTERNRIRPTYQQNVLFIFKRRKTDNRRKKNNRDAKKEQKRLQSDNSTPTKTYLLHEGTFNIGYRKPPAFTITSSFTPGKPTECNCPLSTSVNKIRVVL